MLVSCALAAVAMGLIIGRLYPVVALLIVSPLVGVVAAVAASGEGWSFWHSAVFGGVALSLFQLSFLGGVRLRPGSKRSTVAELAASPPEAADDGTIVRVERSR